ncbi:MAG: alpha-1,2-fucosyltransferase, partial [Bacteroidetes bacterium]|nr:alpha-1,2-fucosyltransferase [Bacteroidota bacterium]
RPHGSLYIEGLWQSEGYFKDIESTIRLELRIKPPTDAVNIDMGATINDSVAIAVHVRFFDMPDDIGVNNAPHEYYVRAVEKMENIAPNAYYYIFSDQPDAARMCIPLPDDRVTSISHNYGDVNAYANLWLMSLCQHFIIANSTFSWWGAWLSNSTDKIVIAPGFEKREGVSGWGFEGLIPDDWIKC